MKFTKLKQFVAPAPHLFISTPHHPSLLKWQMHCMQDSAPADGAVKQAGSKSVPSIAVQALGGTHQPVTSNGSAAVETGETPAATSAGSMPPAGPDGSAPTLSTHMPTPAGNAAESDRVPSPNTKVHRAMNSSQPSTRNTSPVPGALAAAPSAAGEEMRRCADERMAELQLHLAAWEHHKGTMSTHAACL